MSVVRELRARSFPSRLMQNVRSHYWLYILLVPVLAFYIIFSYLPMYGILIAFKDFKLTLSVWDSPWVGLKHFEKFINGVYFKRLVRNTLSINIGQLLIGFPLPILFALLLNEVRSTGFRRVVQTVTYMPHFISSMVICGLMVQFTQTNGLLTQVFSWFGGPERNLLTIPSFFQPLYIGMNVWQQLGWDSIIFFAAITGVDPLLYEAAYMDGAGRWRQIWHVTLPGIAPTIVILLILRIGNLMSLGWERIILLYNEMIYETADVISTYVYRRGVVLMEYSYAAAVGLMNSAINVLLLLSANMLSRRISDTSLW